MSLQVSIEKVNPTLAVVTLSGSLTQGMSLKMADAQIQALVDGGAVHLVLDLGGVPYSDSAGLGMLVHTYGLTEERQGKLRLCGITERVAALLRMTKTDGFFPIDRDVAASLASLQVG